MAVVPASLGVTEAALAHSDAPASQVGFVRGSAACVFALSGLALAGWMFDRVELASWLPRFPTMKANTALCFIALALAFAAHGWRPRPAWRRAVDIAPLLAALLAGATLAEYVVGIDLGIDEALLRDRATAPSEYPGRMAPATAAAIVLLSVALPWPARAPGPWRPLAATLALTIGYLSSMGLLFGASWGSSFGYALSTVSLSTAACMVLLSAAALSVTPRQGTFLGLARHSAGSLFLNRALPLLLVLPAAVFWAEHLAQRNGWWGVSDGLVLGVAALVGVLLYCARQAAGWISALEADLQAGRDLLEQRVAERTAELNSTTAQLRGSREQLASVVETSLDAAVRIDAASRVIGWNPQAQEIFGWSADEAVGRAMHELIVPRAQRDAHLRGMRRFLATGEAALLGRRVELTALHRDGHEFPVELAISRIPGPDGVQFSAFLRDVSERRRAEEARRLLETQRRESQKMEAIGTLAGGIAHDFNNILAAILGHVSLARDDVAAGHPARSSIEQIEMAALRARSLVRQILTFSRRHEPQLSLLTMRPVVDDSLALLRAVLPAGASIGTALSDEPLWVLGDATQLQQVLMNLCTNAWQALDGHAGHVEVGLEAVSLGGSAGSAVALPPGRCAHLWVHDDGRGMDEATRARIFEPFFTTKPIGQGTGLGLAVVHGIVASHEGAIAVDSVPAQGSTFHLYFPLRRAPDGPVAAASAAAEPPQGHGQHVLYVDDDETMLLLVERLLQRCGYRATTCQDAHRALAAVRERPRAFDLVLSDFNMPGLSGIDVARAIAGIRPDLPVLISSGAITDELRAEAKEAGVRGLLRKEHAAEELALLLHRILSPPP